jgi:hypothetical protein
MPVFHVKDAQMNNQTIRFWGIEDNEKTWEKLFNADVDVILTDKLVELKEFLNNKNSNL